MNRLEINLDYAGAREIARKACLRSACFLGFGLNSARDERLRDFSLSKEINLSFLPDDLPIKKIDEFKGEFEKWIVSNGLRELIEGFSIFLDRIYEYSLLASLNGKILDERVKKKIREVKEKGLPGKQMALRKEFKITNDYSKHLKKIYEARNCLSHNRGIVGEGFFNDGDTLKVTWGFLEILMIHKDGHEEVIELKQKVKPICGPGKIARRMVTKEHIFKKGEQVRFSVKDLAEICLFAYIACDSFFSQAIEFAKKNGVIQKEENVKPAFGGQL